MNARRLTVSSRYPESRARTAAPYVPSTPMPFLRLQGRWLDEAGFAIGAQARGSGSRSVGGGSHRR